MPLSSVKRHVLRPPKAVRCLFWMVVIGIAGGCAHHFFWRYHLKRFQVVRQDVFYRVAQPTEFGLRHLVKRHNVETILSLQLFDHQLHGGLFDPGEADGAFESQYVRRLGARHLQWPMGEEQCWPWLTPWQFEEFFKLLDNPENLPVVVHCMGGRHRTGTLSALFRLEYDRWTVDRTLEEMYSFQFGGAILWHEHNLRTYLPRPHPTPEVWRRLQSALEPVAAASAAKNYEALVRQLRATIDTPATRRAVTEYLRQNEPFALVLIQRLIDGPDDPLVPTATSKASACLQRQDAAASDLAMSAALVSDFGTPEQQQELLGLLHTQSQTPVPSAYYEAIVSGVTNRYTPNRIVFLRVLLDDQRQRVGSSTSMYRYCDTAVARLATITNQIPLLTLSPEAMWEGGREMARAWFAQHAEEARLSQLLPPTGKNVVRAGRGTDDEDLSRMR